MYAIEIISKLENRIQFDIYGTLEDKKYWDKCKRLLEKLPRNIVWNGRFTRSGRDIFSI